MERVVTTTNDWDLPDDNDDGSADQSAGNQGPKALREALKKEKAEKKALMDRLDKLEARQRGETVSDVLTELGLDPKASAFYPKDGDPDKAKVLEWAEQHKGLLPKSQKSGDTSPPGDGDGDGDNSGNSTVETTVPSDIKSLYEQLVQNEVLPPPGNQEILKKINTAETEEQLFELIEAAQHQQ